MSSFGVVSIAEVLQILERCAAGYSAETTVHHYRVTYGGKVYPALPLGEHGPKRAKRRAEVKVGDVRKMLRFLGIDFNCAKGVVPRIGQ